MAAGVINQNDLNEIIKSNVENMNNIFDSVKIIIASCKQINAVQMKSVNSAFEKIKKIYENASKLYADIINSSFMQNPVKLIIFNQNIQNYMNIIEEMQKLVDFVVKIKISDIFNIKIYLLEFVLMTAINVLAQITKKINESTNILKSFNTKLLTYALMEILLIVDILDNVKISLFATFKIRLIKKVIQKLLTTIIDIASAVDIKYLMKSVIQLIGLKLVFLLIREILTDILEIFSFKLMFKLWWSGNLQVKRMRTIVKYINKLLTVIQEVQTSEIAGNLKTLAMLNIFILMLDLFLQQINNMKFGLFWAFFLRRKIKQIIKLVDSITSLLYAVNEIPTKIISSQLKTLIQLNIFLVLLDFTTTLLKRLSVGFLLRRKLERLISALRALNQVIKTINKIKLTSIVNATLRLNALIQMIFVLSSILLVLIILTPILLGFAIISPLLILGIWLFAKVVQIILKIISVLLQPKTILGILGLVLIVTAFTLVALAFAILAQLAKSMLEGLGDIFLFLLALIAIVTVMLVVGLLLGLLIIALPFVLLGIAVMFIMVTAIFVIALELYLLQYIELDEKLINKNVETVIRTAFSVIEAVFNQVVDIGGAGKNESWFSKIIHFIGGAAVTFITAILAVAFLAISVVAIGLILFIAAELRLLQILDLQPDLIKANVSIVIATAQMVINTIFDASDDKEDKPSSKGFFVQLIEYCSKDLVDLITAIMAVEYLALMVVAVGLILFIATELRLLQILDLQPDLIVANVSTVISTAQMVTGSVFDPSDDKEDKPSSKGFFLDLINFFSPGLANIVEAIMAIGYLALTVVAISLVVAIADQLKRIAELNLDAAMIQKNTDAVIKAAKHVIDAVIRPDDSKPKSAKDIFKKILRMVLPGNLLDMIDALMAIGFLALAKSAVGLVGEIAQNLTTIAKLPSMNGITGKVDTIVNTSRSVINKIINKGGSLSDKEAKKLSKAGDYIGKLINTIRIIGNLSDAVNTIKTTSKERVTQVQQSVDLVVGLVDSIAAKSKSDVKVTDKKLRQMNYMMNVIERINKISAVDVQNSEAVLRNYSQFIDKVSNSNLDNLKTTTHMFAKMAEFSKSIHGDFDALADTINEKIAPLLEDLKKIMEDVHTKIEKTGSDISSSVYASSQDSLSPDEMSKQIEREMPNSSKEEQQEALQRKLEAQAQRQNNNIVDKLDELIELFETGRARMRQW